jgi:hypothetical protein
VDSPLRLLLCLLTVLTTLTTGAAADRAIPPKTAGQLVEQLGHRDFRQRTEAARKLETLGAGALPALRKALAHPDPEVRKRAGELVARIEAALALAPHRVSLVVRGKTIREVVDELARQTGYKIDLWGDDGRQLYSFDLKRVPFWVAVDEVCRAGGLTVQHGYGDDRLRLQKGEEGAASHVSYSGPFRVVPLQFQMHRTVQFGARGPRRSETLTLDLRVFVEPGTPLLSIGEPTLDEAVDVENTRMRSGAPDEAEESTSGFRGRSRFGNGHATLSGDAQISLRRGSNRAQAVKVLRGSLPVTLLVEQKPVVVADRILSVKNKTVKVGTTTFEIAECTQTPNKQWQLRMALREENNAPDDYTWINSLYRRIELQDTAGNRLQMFGSSWGHSDTSNVRVAYTYGPASGGKSGPPARLVYQVWKTRPHLVRFEFKDLPLP